MIDLLPATSIAPVFMVVRPPPGTTFEAFRRWTLIGFSWKLIGMSTESEAIYVDRSKQTR